MTGLLRKRHNHEAKVSSSELFFDLVFVFAVTQLSHTLLAQLTLYGAIQTGLLLMGVWWVWLYTSWATNWLDPQRNPVRLLLFVLMAAGLALSMSINDAWGARGLSFAIAYVLIQVGRSLFMLFAFRPHSPTNFRNFTRITIWLAAAGCLWLMGALAVETNRFTLWSLALAIEYAGPSLSFRVPGLGHSLTTDWDIEGGHLAERCGLFIIIALGESILITGATTAKLDWNVTTILAFFASFLGTVAMWWIYFNIGAQWASNLITYSEDPGRIARLSYTYLHLPIVGGIIVSAAADELILAHPYEPRKAAATAAIIGGPALYLLGNLLFKRFTLGCWELSHLSGLVACALLIPVSAFTNALELGLSTTAILIVVASWETIALCCNGTKRSRSWS